MVNRAVNAVLAILCGVFAVATMYVMVETAKAGGRVYVLGTDALGREVVHVENLMGRPNLLGWLIIVGYFLFSAVYFILNWDDIKRCFSRAVLGPGAGQEN